MPLYLGEDRKISLEIINDICFYGNTVHMQTILTSIVELFINSFKHVFRYTDPTNKVQNSIQLIISESEDPYKMVKIDYIGGYKPSENRRRSGLTIVENLISRKFGGSYQVEFIAGKYIQSIYLPNSPFFKFKTRKKED